jgi:hypothetical protein
MLKFIKENDRFQQFIHPGCYDNSIINEGIIAVLCNAIQIELYENLDQNLEQAKTNM